MSEKDNEEYLNEICGWMAETFTSNYIVIERVDNNIAGGWVDNKLGWEKAGHKVDRSQHSRLAEYELRCMASDATAFLLRWQ